MITHADKSKENKSQSVANGNPQTQHSGESTFQFVDNRPETIQMRRLQEMANSGISLNHPIQLQTAAVVQFVKEIVGEEETRWQSELPENKSEIFNNPTDAVLHEIKNRHREELREKAKNQEAEFPADGNKIKRVNTNIALIEAFINDDGFLVIPQVDNAGGELNVLEGISRIIGGQLNKIIGIRFEKVVNAPQVDLKKMTNDMIMRQSLRLNYGEELLEHIDDVMKEKGMNLFETVELMEKDGTIELGEAGQEGNESSSKFVNEEQGRLQMALMKETPLAKLAVKIAEIANKTINYEKSIGDSQGILSFALE